MMFEDYLSAVPSIFSSMNTLLSPVVPFVLLNVMIGIIAFTSKLANQTKHSSNQQDHSHQNHQNQSHNHHQQQQQFQQKKNWLARSPSILERVRSINLYSYKSQEPNLVTSSTSATTNFSFEHVQKHENSSQYIFEQPHQETHQESTPQPQVHVQYTFGHTQEENTQKSNASSTNIKEFASNNDNAEHLEQEQHHQEEEEEVEDVFEEDGDELESLDEVYTNSTLNHLTRTKSDTDPCSGEAPQKLPTKIRKSASMKSSFGHFEAEDIVETLRPKTMREMGVAKMTEMDHGVDAKADNFISMFRNQLKLQRMDSIIRYKEMITRGSEK